MRPPPLESISTHRFVPAFNHCLSHRDVILRDADNGVPRRGCVFEALCRPGYRGAGAGHTWPLIALCPLGTHCRNLLCGRSHVSPRGPWSWRPDPQSQPLPYSSISSQHRLADGAPGGQTPLLFRPPRPPVPGPGPGQSSSPQGRRRGGRASQRHADFGFPCVPAPATLVFAGPVFPSGISVFCGVGVEVPLESKWDSAYTLDVLQSGAAPASAREPDSLFGVLQLPEGQGPHLSRGGRLSQNLLYSLVHRPLDERARWGLRDYRVRLILLCG